MLHDVLHDGREPGGLGRRPRLHGGWQRWRRHEAVGEGWRPGLSAEELAELGLVLFAELLDTLSRPMRPIGHLLVRQSEELSTLLPVRRPLDASWRFRRARRRGLLAADSRNRWIGLHQIAAGRHVQPRRRRMEHRLD